MNKCHIHNIPLTAVGMTFVCLKCNPLHKVTGFSIDSKSAPREFT